MDPKIGAHMQRKQCNRFCALGVITTNNMTLFFLDILLFMISDTIIIGLCFTYQPKSPLLRAETVYTARNIDIQHANMSHENDTGHFIWFLNVYVRSWPVLCWFGRYFI